MIRRILFIGAGKLGTSLAFSLCQKGFFIPCFVSKEFPNKIKSYLPNTSLVSNVEQADFKDVEIIIITVPDDQINLVANHLAVLNIDWNNKCVMHTSGCLNSNELSNLKVLGAFTGSLHPMQTFDKTFLSKDIFNDIVFTVEGDLKIREFAKKIAEMFKAKLMDIDSDKKTLYHVAAVASSNFLVGLLDYVSQLYRELGFEEQEIKELISPIMNQTINNFNLNESKTILTGPLKRGDIGTIEKHIKYLKAEREDLLPVYKEISSYIIKFIIESNESETDKWKRIL